MKKNFLPSFLIVILLIPMEFCFSQIQTEFLSGADVLLREKSDILTGKRVGIVTNHTSILKDGTHLIDSLIKIKGVKVESLFAPEHGIRGNVEAGANINSETDPKTGLKIVSLYGKNYKPSKENLSGIDLLLFDLQDVGARYYTYISTLYYIIEACAENKIPLIILDRPNPISPIKIDGPLIDRKFRSFIAIAPVPIIHGMTVGELARYFAYLLKKEKKIECNLEIIKMKKWDRKKFFDSYYKEWIKPSPNMPDLETAIVYPGTCLIEGTNISEGRGTDTPFLTIGAPFINSALLIKELLKLNIKGVKFEPVQFTPHNIPGMAINPKYKNELCNGIRIKVTVNGEFEPLRMGIKLLWVLKKSFPEFRFNDKTIDKLFGSDYLRKMLTAGAAPEKIFFKWHKELNNFINLHKKFLLY